MRRPAIALAVYFLFSSATHGGTMEQAVIVRFLYGSTDLSRLHALEDQIEEAIANSKVGEFDGDEVRTDGRDGVLYMYGPDADRLYVVVVPILRTADFMEGAMVTRRYGPAKSDAPEVTDAIRLSTP